MNPDRGGPNWVGIGTNLADNGPTWSVSAGFGRCRPESLVESVTLVDVGPTSAEFVRKWSTLTLSPAEVGRFRPNFARNRPKHGRCKATCGRVRSKSIKFARDRADDSKITAKRALTLAKFEKIRSNLYQVPRVAMIDQRSASSRMATKRTTAPEVIEFDPGRGGLHLRALCVPVGSGLPGRWVSKKGFVKRGASPRTVFCQLP